LTRAPPDFDATSLRSIVPDFQRRASGGEYWLIGRGTRRVAVVLLRDAGRRQPASGLVPLDPAFPKRIDVLMQFWRLLHDKAPALPRERLTRLGRQRLLLKLRALDARLAG